MALAFHILAHRDPAQVRRLVDAIWAPEHTFVLHYDRRRPAEEHRAIAALAEGRTNLYIQEPRAVLWGRGSLYMAQHEGLKLALKANAEWTHWFNLSGQCYPLTPVEEIDHECAVLGDRSLVRHFEPLANGDWIKSDRRICRRALDWPWLDKVLWWPGIGLRLRMLLGGANSVPVIPGFRYAYPDDFTWYGGDNWVTLARVTAEYLVGDARAGRIVQRLRHTEVPEESIFQSALMNGPHAGRIVNAHRRCIKWMPGQGSPGLFAPEDWPTLQRAARDGAWFARKFKPASETLDLVDSQLLRKQQTPSASRSPTSSAATTRALA